jgi:hypothetical protein
LWLQNFPQVPQDMIDYYRIFSNSSVLVSQPPIIYKILRASFQLQNFFQVPHLTLRARDNVPSPKPESKSRHLLLGSDAITPHPMNETPNFSQSYVSPSERYFGKCTLGVAIEASCDRR